MLHKEAHDSFVETLCRIGGVAAWLLFAYSLATLVQIALLGGQPTTASEAFDLLQRNTVVGLLRLDVPTVLALPLYYLVFLGLYARRGRCIRSGSRWWPGGSTSSHPRSVLAERSERSLIGQGADRAAGCSVIRH